MKYVFRVEAGNKIGLGHFYRSLNIAEKLTSDGHEVIFASCYSEFWELQLKLNFQFKHFYLPQENSNEYAISEMLKDKIDVYYIDGVINLSQHHYQWLNQEKIKVVFYQNIGEGKENCDFYILPSLHQDRDFFSSFTEQTQIFQGLKYFTFNKEIESLKKKSSPNSIKNIAITSGGSDPKNVLKSWFEILSNRLFDNFNFTLYYGKDYLFKENISSLGHYNIHWKVFNHKSILENDLLISAFGVSTYEFLALGMPILSFGHQESNAIASDYLDDQLKVLISLGLISRINTDQVHLTLSTMQSSLASIEAMLTRADNIIDLDGVKRVKQILENIN